MISRTIPDPLFIGGFPGSGTDLVKTILNVHPEVYLLGEVPFLMRTVRKAGFKPNETITEQQSNHFKKVCKQTDDFNNLLHDDVQEKEIVGDYPPQILARLHGVNPVESNSLRYWGNKTPQNTEDLLNISWFYPEQKFVLVVRDVRDVALSWRSKWGKHLYGCAEKWRARMMQFLEDSREVESQVYVIRFEELVDETEGVLRDLCDFLGLPFEERLLEHHKYIGDRDGKRNYGKPIKSDNTAKWKQELSENEIEKIERISRPGLEEFGYSLRNNLAFEPLSKPEVAWTYFYDAVSRLTVGNRSSEKTNFLNRVNTLSNSVLRFIRKRLN